jgi:hypothetical protein
MFDSLRTDWKIERKKSLPVTSMAGARDAETLTTTIAKEISTKVK